MPNIYRIAASFCFLHFLAGAVFAQGFGAMGASETFGNTLTGSWVPHLVANRGLNFGPGNAWNVAVDGATSATLLTQNQHILTRNNVQAGNVNYAFLTIGGNDFLAQGANIASGALSGPALTAFINNYVANVTTATDTVLSASPSGFVLVSAPDISLLPAGIASFTDPIQRQRVHDATDQANAGLRALAISRSIVFVDFAGAQRYLAAQPSVVIGGVTFNMTMPGGADHFFQDAIHPGAAGNGVIASLFATGLDVGYSLNIAPLTDLEILQNAGLAGQYTGETFTPNINYRQFVTFAVPEPHVAFLLLVPVVAIMARNRWRNATCTTT